MSEYTAGQLMDLCLELNCDEFHVFCKFRGHVNKIEVYAYTQGFNLSNDVTYLGYNYPDRNFGDTLEQIRDKLLDAYNNSRGE